MKLSSRALSSNLILIKERKNMLQTRQCRVEQDLPVAANLAGLLDSRPFMQSQIFFCTREIFLLNT